MHAYYICKNASSFQKDIRKYSHMNYLNCLNRYLKLFTQITTTSWGNSNFKKSCNAKMESGEPQIENHLILCETCGCENGCVIILKDPGWNLKIAYIAII